MQNELEQSVGNLLRGEILSSLFYYRGEIPTLAAFSRALVFRMTKLGVSDAEKF